MKTIRVFPRRTRATPDDARRLPDLFDEADRVEVSVAFTWDIPEAEYLARQWSVVAPVEIGGPAMGTRGEEFVPGRYLKHGYTITSRGCPNRCWFCSVWKREGSEIRELPIRDGFNVLDDNLLACSEQHIRAVVAMLERQPQAAQFTGGLEAARLQRWHAELLRSIKPKRLFFAYDTPDDLEPLRDAGSLLRDVGFTTASHALACYVLCGYPKDTTEAAEVRMREVLDAGFVPMAMAYRDKDGHRTREIAEFQRRWARPTIIFSTDARTTDMRTGR